VGEARSHGNEGVGLCRMQDGAELDSSQKNWLIGPESRHARHLESLFLPRL